MDLGLVSLLFCAAVAAGWVDAVIGGGGLILIPAILAAFPQLAPATALGTNKLASVVGTSSAAVTMWRRVRPPLRVMRVYVPLAVAGSALGASAVALLREDAVRPLIIVLLLAVGAFVALRPSFGSGGGEPVVTGRRIALGSVAVAAISLYDGFFGPGTGMFLIFALTWVFSQSFLHSAVMAKVINASTNLGALAVFAWGGHLWLVLGAVLAVGNVIGAQLGARTVLGGGAKVVRVAVLVLVVVMAGYLAWKQWG